MSADTLGTADSVVQLQEMQDQKNLVQQQVLSPAQKISQACNAHHSLASSRIILDAAELNESYGKMFAAGYKIWMLVSQLNV